MIPTYFEDTMFTKNERTSYLNSLLNASNHGINLKKHFITKLRNKVFLSNEKNYSIYRITFDIQGILLTGLLFEIDSNLPLVIMQHGVLGTPEVMSNLYEDRNSSNYTNITMRLLSLNVNVFEPQLLLWAVEKYDVPYDRLEISAKFQKFGYSLVNVETYLLCELIRFYSENSNYKFIDMFGMSFGAMYTYLVANETKLVNKCCAFSYALKQSVILDSLENDALAILIKKAYEKHNLKIVIGDKDPIINYEKTYCLFSSFSNMDNVVMFNGEHEIISDDKVLKAAL